MTSDDNMLVSVSLSRASWEAIQEILELACQIKGTPAWVQWGHDVYQIIQEAIIQAEQNASIYGEMDSDGVYGEFAERYESGYEDGGVTAY